MTLQNLNEVLKIFTHQEKEEDDGKVEEEEEEDDEFNGSSLMKNEMITQIKERRREKQPACVRLRLRLPQISWMMKLPRRCIEATVSSRRWTPSPS